MVTPYVRPSVCHTFDSQSVSHAFGTQSHWCHSVSQASGTENISVLSIFSHHHKHSSKCLELKIQGKKDVGDFLNVTLDIKDCFINPLKNISVYPVYVHRQWKPPSICPAEHPSECQWSTKQTFLHYEVFETWYNLELTYLSGRTTRQTRRTRTRSCCGILNDDFRQCFYFFLLFWMKNFDWGLWGAKLQGFRQRFCSLVYSSTTNPPLLWEKLTEVVHSS